MNFKPFFALTLISASLLLLSCDVVSKPKSPEELRAELKLHELSIPNLYLESSEVKLQRQRKKVRNAGLFRPAQFEDDGALIQGNIVNKASLAKYKDVIVKVGFYSKTETLIEENSYILYDYFEPNTSKPFSLRIETPNNYESFGLQISDAAPASY